MLCFESALGFLTDVASQKTRFENGGDQRLVNELAARSSLVPNFFDPFQLFKAQAE